jgi:carbon monoxide dehydrogenase subunit G
VGLSRTNFAVTTLIRVTPDQVFWFLSDPSTAAVIDPAVVSYEPEGGTMGVGIRNHIRLRMVGIPLSIVSETTEWEPGDRMSFRSIEPGRPVIGLATHRFEACSDGTRYTWSMDFVPTGVGGRLAAVLGARILERNAVAQQDRVRRVLEAAVRLPNPGVE